MKQGESYEIKVRRAKANYLWLAYFIDAYGVKRVIANGYSTNYHMCWGRALNAIYSHQFQDRAKKEICGE